MKPANGRRIVVETGFDASVLKKIVAAFEDALPKCATGQAANYPLSYWSKLTVSLKYPELEQSTNLAENAMHSIASGRRNYLFACSDAGGRRAAIFYGLIGIERLNGLDPEAYLRYVLARIGEHLISRIEELLP